MDLAALRTAVKRDPSDVQATLALAKSLIRVGRDAEAMGAIRALEKRLGIYSYEHPLPGRNRVMKQTRAILQMLEQVSRLSPRSSLEPVRLGPAGSPQGVTRNCVLAVGMGPCEETLAVGYENGYVAICQVAGGSERSSHRFLAHQGPISCISVSEDPPAIITVGREDRFIRIWVPGRESPQQEAMVPAVLGRASLGVPTSVRVGAGRRVEVYVAPPAENAYAEPRQLDVGQLQQSQKRWRICIRVSPFSSDWNPKMLTALGRIQKGATTTCLRLEADTLGRSVAVLRPTAFNVVTFEGRSTSYRVPTSWRYLNWPQIARLPPAVGPNCSAVAIATQPEGALGEGSNVRVFWPERGSLSEIDTEVEFSVTAMAFSRLGSVLLLGGDRGDCGILRMNRAYD